MNVVICDDDSICREAVSGAVTRWAAAHGLTQAVMQYAFASTEDLLEEWENGLETDLLFLDIQVPGEMNGLELAKRIRERDARACIAFLTNYAEFACEGYSVNALRYLRKPVAEPRLHECLDIAYRQWRDAQASSLFIDTQRRKVIVPCRQLAYAEARGHYLDLHLTEGPPVQARCNIAALTAQLPARMFVQCHRSYVVNLLYVRNLTKSAVTLAGDVHIPVGTRFAEDVSRAVRLFYQGGAEDAADRL